MLFVGLETGGLGRGDLAFARADRVVGMGGRDLCSRWGPVKMGTGVGFWWWWVNGSSTSLCADAV